MKKNIKTKNGTDEKSTNRKIIILEDPTKNFKKKTTKPILYSSFEETTTFILKTIEILNFPTSKVSLL